MHKLSDSESAMLLAQHQQILDRMVSLEVLVGGIIFCLILLIVGVCGLAAWSVSRTVKGFTDHTSELRSEWSDTRKELVSAMGMLARYAVATNPKKVSTATELTTGDEPT